MSELKLIELDIKGKKFASRKIRRIKWLLRILAVLIILACIGLSALLVYNALNPKPQQEIPHQTETPIVQTGAEMPEYPEGRADITGLLLADESMGKKAYLTFDDGPSENTAALLDVLKAYNIKATFFVTGEAANKNPDLLVRIHNEGHAIGNHSNTHVYNNIYDNPDSFWLEVTGAQKIFENILGPENVQKLFRFPGGSFGEKKEQFLPLIESMGYKYVDWNALNGDAEGGEFTAEKAMEYIEEQCTDTGNVIVLMHDAKNKTVTVETLPQIIEYLKSEGYSFDKITVN
ncbi:MAG: polysaccharide deacetylase [Clostridia bacterium]|nr:polysaccharide deacetylase [Clostridia bacterium]